MTDPRADPLKFGLHFGCGAAMGGAVALPAAVRFLQLDAETWSVLAIATVVALVVGLVAGFRGDRLWHDLGG